MSRNLSDQEFHALYCPAKNTKSALFLVAFFSWETFISWKGLHKPVEHRELFEMLFGIIVVIILAKGLVAFTCLAERLVLILTIASLVAGEISGFFPAIVQPYSQALKYVKLVLWVLCLPVSATMLIQAARAPKVKLNEHLASSAQQAKQNLHVALVIVIAVLVLSPLIYLLPLQWVRWLARLVSF